VGKLSDRISAITFIIVLILHIPLMTDLKYLWWILGVVIVGGYLTITTAEEDI